MREPQGRGSRIEVRPEIIKKNTLILKDLADGGFFCPMVKANAYGHGVETVATALSNVGVLNLGVATWDEALELRELGFDQSVLVFSRLHNEQEADLVLKWKLTLVASRLEDLECLEKRAHLKKEKISVHVKVDTGIHRMGFSLFEVPKVVEFFKRSKWVQLTGLLTHMSHGEDGGSPSGMTEQQVQKFAQVRSQFSENHLAVHALSTAAMLERSKTFSDVAQLGCRPGIGLYGAVADPRLTQLSALRVVSQIDHMRTIDKGEGVSYGWSWKAARESLVGVVPIGYGDGFFRSLSNKGFVLVHGERAPIIGAVCMDYVLIDLTDLAHNKNVRAQDEVVILGEQGQDVISPMEIANWAGTIPYEVLTSLGIKKNRMEVVS